MAARARAAFPRVVHRPRLLAGLLPVRPDPHAADARAVPGLFAGRGRAAWPAAHRRHRIRAHRCAQTYLRREHGAEASKRSRRPSAVIAVSSVIARDLRRARAGAGAHAARGHPEPGEHRRAATSAPRRRGRCAEPYALYVGKLAVNKGTDHLVDVVRASRPRLAAGHRRRRSRPRRASRRRRAHAARDVRFIGWLDQAQTADWIAHAGMLIFPSRGPESLSRVLIEASALGVPIAAMNTGGTTDIVEDEVTGLLSDRPVRAGRRRAADPAWRGPAAAARRGGGEARRPRSSTRAAVVARIEALYTERHPGAAAVSAPLRVAITARSVFPLHGLGGLERSVYDLARHLARNGVRVTLITRTPHAAGRRRRGPPATCSSRSCRTGRSPSPDGEARRCSTGAPPIRSSATRAGALAAEIVARGERRHRPRLRRQRARLRAAAAHRCRRPLVLNPQGLEEFGAHRSVARAAEARRVPAAAARRHRLRAPRPTR